MKKELNIIGGLLLVIVVLMAVGMFKPAPAQPMGSTNIGNDYHYTQFSGSIATSTLIQAGVSTLGNVTITEDFAGALTFWDATSTAAVTTGVYATKIAVLQSALTEGSYIFDVSAIRGLVMVSADGFAFAGDMTVSWR